MSHIEDDDPPIKTKHASKEFRDGWDRTFGNKDPEPCVVCGETGHDKLELPNATVTACPEVPVDRPLLMPNALTLEHWVGKSGVPDNDAIEVRVRHYAHFGPAPVVARIGPIEPPEDPCDVCGAPGGEWCGVGCSECPPPK